MQSIFTVESVSIEEIMKEQESKRAEVIENSNRAHSALALAKFALEHSCDSSNAAARLLLSMEQGQAFDFRLLLKFDATNRAHADIVMMGYQPHYLWPSSWINDELGLDGKALMRELAEKYNGEN